MILFLMQYNISAQPPTPPRFQLPPPHPQLPPQHHFRQFNFNQFQSQQHHQQQQQQMGLFSNHNNIFPHQNFLTTMMIPTTNTFFTFSTIGVHNHPHPTLFQHHQHPQHINTNSIQTFGFMDTINSWKDKTQNWWDTEVMGKEQQQKELDISSKPIKNDHNHDENNINGDEQYDKNQQLLTTITNIITNNSNIDKTYLHELIDRIVPDQEPRVRTNNIDDQTTSIRTGLGSVTIDRTRTATTWD